MVCRIVLIVGLLILSGCGPSKGKQAVDACNRGVYRYEEGEFDKAIDDFTEAIRLDPKDADAHYFRGKAYDKKGERAKAEADFAKARQLGYRGPE